MKSAMFSGTSRKCSPVLAAAAGAAVCFGGGNVWATSGNVAASNAGATSFVAPSIGIKLFGSAVTFALNTSIAGGYFYGATAGLFFDMQGTSSAKVIRHFAAGVPVAGLTFFRKSGFFNPNQSNNYIAARFTNGGTRYGWVHCISTNSNGKQLRIDTWSYNASGGGIKTLDESITSKKLSLSDGRVKLNWSNANEEGVARYEIQAKGADGKWSAVDSSVPGEGSYAATVQAGEYRLKVESVDGATRELAF